MDSHEDEMNIYLKVSKTIALKVKTSETIKKLKAMVHDKEGVPENLQELFFTGERLKDNHKLVDYGIRMNSTLNLFLQNLDLIKLLVYIPSHQKRFQIEAKTHDTVRNVKFLIQAKENIQLDRYSLFYDGKPLDDNRTLSSLNILTESVLFLVFNPRELLSLSVKMPSGEILKLEVKVLYTVGDVKAIITSMAGFPVSEQKLTYAGNQLEDSRPLACYNIGEDSVLEMLPFTFQIFVKDWYGKTLVLDVLGEDKVSDVKSKIFEKRGLPDELYYLVFAGKPLKDNQDLA
ncbi:uncharacterized protein LOC130759686 isoform X1 [Actinidia eriantha]|uniref:uncharacterized protein LOC130759686 isoform X1 n=1 Tax=Actinidia eriantha TaxID=165200 RepID=UPI00258C26A4|nr:uncharacterized protein LOC130759686 isoform X1 [Actinidia eriantha]